MELHVLQPVADVASWLQSSFSSCPSPGGGSKCKQTRRSCCQRGRRVNSQTALHSPSKSQHSSSLHLSSSSHLFSSTSISPPHLLSFSSSSSYLIFSPLLILLLLSACPPLLLLHSSPSHPVLFSSSIHLLLSYSPCHRPTVWRDSEGVDWITALH